MKNSADIVIIGGGIVGTSLLYHLAERGITNVQLVEMEQIGSGSTSRSAAWITYQQALELNSQLTVLSMKEYLEFAEKFETDIYLEKPGSIQIGDISQTQEMLIRARRQNSQGVFTEILSVNDMKKVVPFVNFDNIEIGLYCKDDARVDPHPIMYAYIKYAKMLGASVDVDVKAIDIVTKNRKVVGVNTSKGIISTPIAVNAAGFWAAEVGKWVGIDIPLRKDVNHELITKPTKYNHFPFLQILTPTPIYIGYYGPDCDHISVGIGQWDTEDLLQNADINRLLDEFGDALQYRLPEIFELEITNYWAGIRPLNPDGLPILGPVDSVEGYINDCCWAGKGVAHAPAGGIILSDYLVGSLDTRISIEPFLFKRFGA